MSIFRWKKLKNFPKEYVKKSSDFTGKKLKVFSKIVKSARKNSNFQSQFFTKTGIFSGKPKNF